VALAGGLVFTGEHQVRHQHPSAGQWSYLCVIAPLRLPGGTGSPVNPIAIA
jgi:hypothetical protein